MAGSRRVVVTGTGAVTPIGNDVPTFWSALKEKMPEAFDQANDYRTVSMLVAPLRGPRGEVLGVLELVNAVDGEGRITTFDEDDSAGNNPGGRFEQTA